MVFKTEDGSLFLILWNIPTKKRVCLCYAWNDRRRYEASPSFSAITERFVST